MNICIVGGGNIGTYLATSISMKENINVYLYTKKADLFKKELAIIDEESEQIHYSKNVSVTNNIEDSISKADVILVTLPSSIIENTLIDICKYVKKNTMIGVIPGFGGVEFYKNLFLEKECIFFGTQRVPVIARLEKYGECVRLKKKNEFMKIATFPTDKCVKVCEELEKLLDIKCKPLKNYISITLTPSNSAMHPARLYELFNNYIPGKKEYKKVELFYQEWGDEASQYLLDIDMEIQSICEKIPRLNYEEIETIKGRFNINNKEELTMKINKEQGFKGIYTDMIESDNGYIPNLDSRYFTSDIGYGICIIKSFAEIYNVDTPVIDKIIEWAQIILDKEYIKNNRLCGKDISGLLIPQNYNIKNKEDVDEYYQN